MMSKANCLVLFEGLDPHDWPTRLSFFIVIATRYV